MVSTQFSQTPRPAQPAAPANALGRRESGSLPLRRPSAPAPTSDVATIPVIPEYDGATSLLPPIVGFRCGECGARGRPGAGVNRQSLIECQPGIRRGGKCRTCRRVATRASRIFHTTIKIYMAAHGHGLDVHARGAALQEALRLARLAMWEVYVAAALRTMQRTAGMAAA